MTLLELTLETAINEAGEFKDVRLSKEDAACILALLKEHEPRVLTLNEAAADQEVWTEVKLRGTEHIPLFISILWLTDDVKDFELELMGKSKKAFMLSKEYGKTWRCWSAKPTDEQRKAVKWE